MSRYAAILWSASAWVACASMNPAGAAGPPPAVTIENVRAGFGDGLGGGRYKTGTWTPIWVDLKAGKEPFQGFLEVITSDDNGTPTVARREIALAPDAFTTFSIYARPGTRSGELNVRVVDARGRVKATPSGGGGGSLESFGPETGIVLTGGNPVGIADMKDLPKFAGAMYNGSILPFVVLPVRARDGFPSRWYGFDAADALVLDTNDQGTLNRLAASSQSVREWVRQGGHLVVAVGSNWQAVKDSPLAAMLPGIPAGRVRLNDKAVLESFAGNSAHPIKEDIQVTRFEGWEARGGISLAATSASPVVVRGPYGFGRVTLIGLDVDQKPFSTWEDRKAFWDKALDLRGRGNDPNSGNGVNPSALYRNTGFELGNLLNDSLQRFPGVRLVPFGWVAFFVFVYILLIGPGDYLFLRKVVKRMELTWVTFPAIVIAVSAIAYFAAYAFKGTDLRINKVDLLDIDQTTGLVRGTTWLTLFSPQNRDYDLAFVPLRIDAEPPADPIAPASAKRPANVETLVSWFGAEQNFGGSGMSLADSGYEYGPPGEAEEVTGVRVQIWSTKSFTGRWWGGAGTPLLASDLAPSGPDRISGSVTNASNRPLRNAAVLFGKFAYVLGDGNLAPGQTATINTLEAKPLSTFLEGGVTASPTPVRYYNGRPMAVTGDDEQAEAGRAGLIRKILFHDALGQNTSPYTNMSLKSLDLTPQLELGRPMLLADCDGPAALLQLGGAGGRPKVKQTTLVRVVLPLKEGAGPPP